MQSAVAAHQPLPRIDPLQLLKCLSVLLSYNGGIRSQSEVERLVSLMTKFSKKLVSKCIYIQILKKTRTDLLGMFMGVGGWGLTHTWLSDAILAKNWPLIQELLELLLICPVDVERLKLNNCPKLIKGLCKEGNSEDIRQLANSLVEKWLKIVKGECVDVKPQIDILKKKLESDVKLEVPAIVPKVEVKEEQTENSIEASHSNNENTVNISPVPEKPEEPPVVASSVCDVNTNSVVKSESVASDESGDDPVGHLPVYKITIRDGKQVLSKLTSKKSPDSAKPTVTVSSTPESSEVSVGPELAVVDIPAKQSPKIESPVILKVEEVKQIDSKPVKDVQKKNKDPANKHSKQNDKKLKTSDIHKEKLKESPKEKSKEKIKDKDAKLKDKKSIQDLALEEKEKAYLAKMIPPAINKLGKIPKKPSIDDKVKISEVKSSVDTKPLGISEGKKSLDPKKNVSEPKKSSISIEIRKPSNDSPRPKTVKTYNSKFRSTGLEEEVKPPPSRPLKKPNVVEKKPVKLPSLKRPSPTKDLGPVEKKSKPLLIDPVPEETKKIEKTGSIKLIPPRPKPSFLQESDMFMDALNASSKKEPRKRKRRTSNSKDGPDPKKESISPKDDTSKTQSSPSSPTNDGSKSPPVVKPTFKFYQDTLETEEDKELEEGKKDGQDLSVVKIDEGQSNSEDLEGSDSVNDTSLTVDETGEVSYVEEMAAAVSISENEIRGVLVFHKVRKGPKKSVQWREDKELEEIKYFELDETERVNVTKTFTDMKLMERSNEREAFILARKLSQDDVMEEKAPWRPLIPVDCPPNLVEPGKNSEEVRIQYAREKTVLQAIYFSRTTIPASPAEPDLEIHATTDPTIIPLEDLTGNPDSVNDYQNVPWPEPKPMLAPQSPPQQTFQQPQFPAYQSQTYPAHIEPVFPNQNPIPNNMPMGMMMPAMNTMNPNAGDWRTGDGKIIPMNDMGMPMDMYNQGMPMNMGMPQNMVNPAAMGNPMPDMGYGMMGEEMNQGGPYPMQGYPIGGPMNMNSYPSFQRGRGPGNPRGGRGGVNAGRGGNWYRGQGGGSWQSGGGPSGGSSRGGRGNWNGPSRTLCKHFRAGYCRTGEKCPFLHPGINGPAY